jgi:hypothetical protein
MWQHLRKTIFGVLFAAFSAQQAFGNDAAALTAFRYLCIGGGYIPGDGPDIGLYPERTSIDSQLLFNRLPPVAEAEVVDAWDLTPNGQEGERLALAIMLFQNPPMGEMASCIILAEGVSEQVLNEGLSRAGAEQDGDFTFMEGIGRVWFVSASTSEDGTGDGILMAATPNGPLADE